MTRHKKTRDERIAVRVSSQTRDLLKNAALAEGRTLSDFIVQSAQKAAKEALLSDATLKLTLESQEHFIRCIENPSQPNERLKSALVDHDRLIGDL